MIYKKYCKIGAILTIVLGTLLHFAYDFFGEDDFVAIFSAVNESTWEHLKLLFFPVMAFAFVEYFIYGKAFSNFWASKVISLILGMLSIVIVFYTYTGIIGSNNNIANIVLFVASVILTYWLNYRFLEAGRFDSVLINRLAIAVGAALFVMFWVYTFYPPLLNLFKDPVTNGYGI